MRGAPPSEPRTRPRTAAAREPARGLGDRAPAARSSRDTGKRWPPRRAIRARRRRGLRPGAGRLGAGQGALRGRLRSAEPTGLARASVARAASRPLRSASRRRGRRPHVALAWRPIPIVDRWKRVVALAQRGEESLVLGGIGLRLRRARQADRTGPGAPGSARRRTPSPGAWSPGTASRCSAGGEALGPPVEHVAAGAVRRRGNASTRSSMRRSAAWISGHIHSVSSFSQVKCPPPAPQLDSGSDSTSRGGCSSTIRLAVLSSTAGRAASPRSTAFNQSTPSNHQ